MGFGIALAGGGTRGAAHVGVLLALAEEGMLPHAVAGTSAGALVGGLYASGLSPKRLASLIRQLSRHKNILLDPDYGGLLYAVFQFFTLRTPTVKGLIKGKKLERFVCSLTGGKTIRDLSMKTVIPAVDILTGDTIVYTNTPSLAKALPQVQWQDNALLCDIIRASAAFPGVFHPKEMGGYCLVDGGITDNLPVNLLLAAGEKRVLGVDVSEEYTIPETGNLMETVSHSFTIMSTRLKELVSTGEQMLLHPILPKEAGLLTFDCMEACMEAGYECAKKEMPSIRYVFG